MDITLNNIENIETSRRNLLKYGSLAGISAIVGVNILQNSLSLPNITTSAKVISSTGLVDYTTIPYNVFLVSENAKSVSNLLSNTRISNIYLYSHTINANISNKVIANSTLQNLLLSLGSIIPFDFDITSLDMKSWKVREAFLYISEVYALLQNNKNTSLNEANILASLNTIGSYNRNIYVSSISPWQTDDIKYSNFNAFPIGDIISL